MSAMQFCERDKAIIYEKVLFLGSSWRWKNEMVEGEKFISNFTVKPCAKNIHENLNLFVRFISSKIHLCPFKWQKLNKRNQISWDFSAKFLSFFPLCAFLIRKYNWNAPQSAAIKFNLRKIFSRHWSNLMLFCLRNHLWVIGREMRGRFLRIFFFFFQRQLIWIFSKSQSN